MQNQVYTTIWRDIKKISATYYNRDDNTTPTFMVNAKNEAIN